MHGYDGGLVRRMYVAAWEGYHGSAVTRAGIKAWTVYIQDVRILLILYNMGANRRTNLHVMQ